MVFLFTIQQEIIMTGNHCILIRGGRHLLAYAVIEG